MKCIHETVCEMCYWHSPASLDETGHSLEQRNRTSRFSGTFWWLILGRVIWDFALFWDKWQSKKTCEHYYKVVLVPRFRHQWGKYYDLKIPKVWNSRTDTDAGLLSGGALWSLYCRCPQSLVVFGAFCLQPVKSIIRDMDGKGLVPSVWFKVLDSGPACLIQ